MQRTLKRELKGLEIVNMETIGRGFCRVILVINSGCGDWQAEVGRWVLTIIH